MKKTFSRIVSGAFRIIAPTLAPALATALICMLAMASCARLAQNSGGVPGPGVAGDLAEAGVPEGGAEAGFGSDPEAGADGARTDNESGAEDGLGAGLDASVSDATGDGGIGGARSDGSGSGSDGVGEAQGSLAGAGAAPGEPDGELDAKLVGKWHAMAMAAAGFAERYAFFGDGTFIYACSEMDGLNWERYKTGTWAVSGNDELRLSVLARLMFEGGEIAGPDGGRYIEGADAREILCDPPEPESLALAHAATDPGTGRDVAMIGGAAFYRFDDHPGLMDGYYEMAAAAGSRYGSLGAQTDAEREKARLQADLEGSGADGQAGMHGIGEDAASSAASAYGMGAESTPIMPIRAAFATTDSDAGQIGPRLAPDGAACFFNLHVVDAAPGAGSTPAFAWEEDAGGAPVLMALVDADYVSGGENNNLILPKYGAPAVWKYDTEINVIWDDPDDPTEGIHLMFANGSDVMWVHRNTLSGSTANGGYPVEMAVQVHDDGTGANRFYVPLYAIMREAGGGVLHDPLGDGSHFIYTGGATTGYTGMWESSPLGEYRMEAVIDGAAYSISSYWNGLELRLDGTFVESDRHWQDSGAWALWEKSGRYAFHGRILVLSYETESEYYGADYTSLEPYKVDAPYDPLANGANSRIRALYVDSWDEGYLMLHGWSPLYSGLLERGEADPRPGKAQR